MTNLLGLLRRAWPSILVATGVVMVASAATAMADSGWDIKNAIWGQSNPVLTPFIQFTDSHGINVWQYEISIDRGNPVTGADKWFWTKFVDPLWQLYRDGVLVSIWLIRWVLDFGWMAPVREAAITLNIALSQAIDQMGLVALFLTIAGIVGAFYILKGRIATGVWEMVLACVIVAGLSTFLVNPAGLILNTDHGAAYVARDLSLELVSEVSESPERGADAQVEQITSSLIETFIRQPLQLANFGVVLDGGPCEQVYDEVLKSGPHAWGSEIREKVNGCNSKLGEYAGTPSPSMVTSLIVMYVGAFVVFALAVIIAGAVLKSGVSLAYQAVKSAVTVIVAVLPGAARRPFWGTVADVIVAFGVFVVSFVSLAIFLRGVDVVLGATPDMPAPQRLMIMDILLVVLLVLFLTNKKRLEQSAWKLRELLATRPGGSVGAGSPAPKLNTAMAVSAAANVAHLARDVFRGRKKARPEFNWNNNSGPPLSAGVGGFAGVGFHTPVPGPPAPRPGPSGPWPGPPGPGGPQPLPGGGGGLARQLVDVGAGMALAHVTGGASKVVTAGIQLARLGKPKSRPQLPAGPSTPNPAVRSMQDGKQLPTGRRPLELPPGPSSSRAGSTSTGPSGRRGAGSGSGEQAPRPTAAKAGPPPERRASRASWMSKSQVPTRLQEMQQQRRPVRRPQGPRGR